MDNSLHVCVDKILPPLLWKEAAKRATAENPSNVPPQTAQIAHDPLAMALVTGKLWQNGRVLKVRFLEGDEDIQAKVRQFANEWSKFANIKFDFQPAAGADAEIRIGFTQDGSWSTIGTDALTVPKDQATMNFGWFDEDTADDEYSRVVIHEFGHALGCIHEHQNPAGKIQWNKDQVYRYYMAPPNNWTKDQVDLNLFQKYDENIASRHTGLDKDSIMLYPIPKAFTTNGFEVGMNRHLSQMDKNFINTIYPFN